MGRYVNILYRLARFLAGIPPDAATMLLAVLERPDLLAAVSLWAADQILGHIFVSMLLLILGARVWPKIPAQHQRRLLKALGGFLPPVAHEDETEEPLERGRQDE